MENINFPQGGMRLWGENEVLYFLIPQLHLLVCSNEVYFRAASEHIKTHTHTHTSQQFLVPSLIPNRSGVLGQFSGPMRSYNEVHRALCFG